ncbi:MAG: ice-binding family protein [Bacteroidota bacterium]|nr:ice-binding family protein [Bacteroidota bacterium]
MEKEKKLAIKINCKAYENKIKNNFYKIEIKERIAFVSPFLRSPKMKVNARQFIFTTLIALISPIITFAQLPNLGTAINFAVFTTIGALGNTATSNITGNIGTNNGAITGFGAPTVVNGNIEWANSVTAQCAIDVQAAYNELLGTTPTVTNHPPSFGSSETLSVGVYSIGAAGSLAGNLTLDAAGDPNAIFIFQFGGAFSAGASSTLILSNGTKACNVFWIAEGAINLAALTNMKGTLIANNGAISLGAGGILEGRMLSTAGAASVDNVSITIPTCAVPLPIGLLSFIGYCSKKDILLQWRTSTETNNNYFTIERSLTATNWEIVGTVAGAGNSSSQLNYTLTDITPGEETLYYRLKQTDFNGNYKYGAIICINKCKDSGVDNLIVYPNPTKGKFELLHTEETNTINSIDIFNSEGVKVYTPIDFQSKFDLSNNASGIYFMRIQQNSKVTNLKLILNN